MCTHLRFQVWAPQSTNLLARNRASGERQGCLWCIHHPWAERGGAPEAGAAVESSVTSPWVPLFSFSFWEVLPIQAPLVQTSIWLLTGQPGSLPRILQQPLCPDWAFSHPGRSASPGDLIVLKHSSYSQIFHCPLPLAPDLHICWNTVGCSLCSSDQLRISLALRGSGLRSHLSCCHLPVS